MYYQLTLGEEPSYYDTFTTADVCEFERRRSALAAVYQEAQQYGASIEAYRTWKQFQQAMKRDQLPQQPRVTVREVTHDPLVVSPPKQSRRTLFVRCVVRLLFA